MELHGEKLQDFFEELDELAARYQSHYNQTGDASYDLGVDSGYNNAGDELSGVIAKFRKLATRHGKT